ncbi:MAG: mechanosensitive ion channel [Gammaproteobacteria bacterium]|nr:mechanosensitive ion channel [Gammaproteobacteria bacterium]
MTRSPTQLLIAMLLIALSFGTSADETSTASSPIEVLSALSSVMQGVDSLNQEIERLKQELQNSPDDEALKEELQKLQKRRAELERNFEQVAAGADPNQFDSAEKVSTSWSDDLHEIVSPLINELRLVTADSREAQKLRQLLETLAKKRDVAEQATESLDKLIAKNQDETLQLALDESRKQWQTRLTEAVSQIEAAQLQLTELTRNDSSFLDDVSAGFGKFFTNRGRSIGVAILAVVAVVIVWRLLHRMVVRFGPLHTEGMAKNFAARLFDLGWMAFTSLAAIAAVLVTFFQFDDWLLLSISILFLLGLAWAGKNGLPRYFEQSKLLLNLGAVREGERVMLNGIAWKVGRLGVYTDLINPALEGGTLRVTATDLLHVHSRPCIDQEDWFPTQVGDWILAGDTHACVVSQSPDFTVIKHVGGAVQSYTTSDFLALGIVNLSRNFRVSATFGIDYQHQASATTQIPALFKDGLLQGLSAQFGQDAIEKINVEFASAGASSLDFAILADFKGSVADKFRPIERAIQRICVDVCNEHGWVIPFTQIVVHPANQPTPSNSHDA